MTLENQQNILAGAINKLRSLWFTPKVNKPINWFDNYIRLREQATNEWNNTVKMLNMHNKYVAPKHTHPPSVFEWEPNNIVTNIQKHLHHRSLSVEQKCSKIFEQSTKKEQK